MNSIKDQQRRKQQIDYRNDLITQMASDKKRVKFDKDCENPPNIVVSIISNCFMKLCILQNLMDKMKRTKTELLNAERSKRAGSELSLQMK